MSLTVSAALLEKARRGPVEDAEFVACIADSLLYAWGMIERLAKELDASGAASVQNVEVPPDDRAWGEVFRLVGSDAMRGAVYPGHVEPVAYCSSDRSRVVMTGLGAASGSTWPAGPRGGDHPNR